MTMQFSNHDKISPTAKMVAYWRQFADLPFSKDIAQEFHVEETVRSVFGQSMVDFPRKDFFVPFVEVRYNCIQNFIRKKNLKQVLEFASGVSLRGLAMTSDSSLTYVETDLPDLTNEKVKLVKTIMENNNIQQRKNLFFHSTNILNYTEIAPALEHFDTNRPLLIANEGLFQYLSKEEKKIAAKNIHKVLSQYGGYWVTPDLDTKASFAHSFVDKDDYKKMMDMVNLKTDRNFEANAFDTEAEIFSFFEDIGFNVSYQSQWETSEHLSSLDRGVASDETVEALKKLRLWVLTVK